MSGVQDLRTRLASAALQVVEAGTVVYDRGGRSAEVTEGTVVVTDHAIYLTQGHYDRIREVTEARR